MILLVCGSRNTPASFLPVIKHAISLINPVSVVHGGGGNADNFAGFAATQLKLPVHIFPADWKTYGRAAGPIRNQQMLDEGKPDLVLAIHPESGITAGTSDTVRRATKANIPVVYLKW